MTRLADQATYFYIGQGKHWYGVQANITRRAEEQIALVFHDGHEDYGHHHTNRHSSSATG
jgi:hypothetical protein